MNCGIYCVREYLRLKDLYDGKIISHLERQMNDRGISVLDIIMAFRDNGLNIGAFRCKEVPDELPVIMYLPFFRHFILVVKKDSRFCYIADSMLGCCRIPRAFFRFLFSNICLMMV